MATTYTSRAALQKPAAADRAWDVPLLATIDSLEATEAIGALAVTITEHPSTTLNVKVAAGTYRLANGTAGTYAGTASQAMTASSTNYVYLTDAGVLTVSTSAFPAGNIVTLATVVAGGSTITSVTDNRRCHQSFGADQNTVYLALAGGTFADGSGVVTLTTGTTNGVKIGASTTNKIGAYGVTPVVQPAGAGQAALASATSAALTDSTTGTAGATMADVGASFNQATINSNFASLTSQVNKLITERAATQTLVAAVRSALVSLGWIKGSA